MAFRPLWTVLSVLHGRSCEKWAFCEVTQGALFSHQCLCDISQWLVEPSRLLGWDVTHPESVAGKECLRSSVDTVVLLLFTCVCLKTKSMQSWVTAAICRNRCRWTLSPDNMWLWNTVDLRYSPQWNSLTHVNKVPRHQNGGKSTFVYVRLLISLQPSSLT